MHVIDYPEIKKRGSIKQFDVKDNKILIEFEIFNYVSGDKEIIKDTIQINELTSAKERIETTVNEGLKTLEGLNLLLKDARNKMLESNENVTK